MAIKLDRKVICGAEFVALRMINKCDNLKIGDIYIPQTSGSNERLGFYLVEDVGTKAKEEYGLNVGDFVLADRLASFGHTEPIAIMRYNNVICKTDQYQSTFSPLRNMLFVKPTNTESITNVNGVYVQNYAEKLNTGIITACNFDKELNMPFDVGDEVLLVKGGDHVQLGMAEFFIYKHDMLICKFDK